VRNGNACVCADCGKPLASKRGSRRQRFCDSRCRKRAHSALKWPDRYRTPGTGRSVENNGDNSKACNGHSGGRGSDTGLWRQVIQTEILDAHIWREEISDDGVRGFATQLRQSALVERRRP
jgi:hypothetical protein